MGATKAAALIAALLCSAANAAITADQVTALPGWNGPLLSKMYSGYLSVPGGKHMHYIFVESQRSPANDPVVMWLNGGPGCSSLEGLFNENGPYHITPNTAELYANPYTWNNISSLLYLESPAGVGFSYADTPQGLIFNDTVTANDNLQAILAFFAGFPEFSGNDFYISGESYAGVYVPTTAYAVVNNNAYGGKQVNIKGIMVGNGCLGTDVGVCGNDGLGQLYSLQELRGHGLVSAPTYNNALSACGDWSVISDTCNKWLSKAATEVGHINVYYIYGPCHTNMSSSFASWQQLEGARAAIERGEVLQSPLEHYFKRPPTLLEQKLGGPDGCIDVGDLTAYLNSPAVISALHVTDGFRWVICSGNISYTPTERDERKVIYPTLIEQAKLRVLVYNGEADACVPFTDNEAWTSSMNYTVVQPWSPWMVNEDWVGGYVTRYENDFTFLTVRGAGHMVPQYQPAAAWYMFNRFLNKQPY